LHLFIECFIKQYTDAHNLSSLETILFLSSLSFIVFFFFLQKIFAELGPYTIDFTSSGRYMAVGGRKGHLAIMDMMNLSLIRELQVRLTEPALFGFTH